MLGLKIHIDSSCLLPLLFALSSIQWVTINKLQNYLLCRFDLIDIHLDPFRGTSAISRLGSCLAWSLISKTESCVIYATNSFRCVVSHVFEWFRRESNSIIYNTCLEIYCHSHTVSRSCLPSFKQYYVRQYTSAWTEKFPRSEFNPMYSHNQPIPILTNTNTIR